MSDGELVRQTLQGQPAAYGELARRWSARVLAVCHGRVRCAHRAEELAQEALLRGFRALATLQDPERFGPWLCGIATRACLDWLKSKPAAEQVNGIAILSAIVDGAEQPDVAAARSDELARLMREVEALPDECREAIMLYYYQNATHRELAELLDVSPATINARLGRGRAMLRERLARTFVED